MVRNHNLAFLKLGHRRPGIPLAISWICGISVGSLLAVLLKESSIPLLKASLDCSVSVISLVLVLLTPVFAVFVSLLTSHEWIVYIFSFMKGVCTGHGVLVLLFCFGNSAWLLYVLLAFSNILTLIPIFFLWLTQLNAKRFSVFGNLLYIIFVICICAIDYLLISPCVLAL